MTTLNNSSILKLVGGTDTVQDARRPVIDLLPSYKGWCLVDACLPVELARKVEAMVKAYSH